MATAATPIFYKFLVSEDVCWYNQVI